MGYFISQVMPAPFETDSLLVDRLHQGDETAFRLIFDRLHRKIYLFAYHFLKDKSQSEEIVQDTFLNFWLHREKLDRLRPIEPYLFTIARRTVTDYWRKAATAENFRNQLYQRMEVSRNDTEEVVLLKDLQRITEEGLQMLSYQQQQIFRLSRFDGLTYEEIAEKMQISKDTVKYHLVNAMKKLREHFEKYDVIYIIWLVIFIH